MSGVEADGEPSLRSGPRETAALQHGHARRVDGFEYVLASASSAPDQKESDP